MPANQMLHAHLLVRARAVRPPSGGKELGKCVQAGELGAARLNVRAVAHV